MKRLLLLCTTGLFSFMVCQAQNTKPVQTSNSMDQPYKGPVKNISIGNMMYAQKVMQVWKDYDNNTMDNIADMMADDIVATFPDGSMVKGKENFAKMIKDYRNGFSSVSSKIMACTTLKTPDDPMTTHLNEVWFFNKQGKVAMFHQMAAKDVAEKKN